MQRVFTHLLRTIVIELSLILPLNLSAVEVEIDGIDYDIEPKAKQATVKKVKGLSEVIIPENVVYEGVSCAVTRIGNSAFEGRYGLTYVRIPTSVTSIGGVCFQRLHQPYFNHHPYQRDEDRGVCFRKLWSERSMYFRHCSMVQYLF